MPAPNSPAEANNQAAKAESYAKNATAKADSASIHAREAEDHALLLEAQAHDARVAANAAKVEAEAAQLAALQTRQHAMSALMSAHAQSEHNACWFAACAHNRLLQTEERANRACEAATAAIEGGAWDGGFDQDGNPLVYTEEA